MILFVSLYFVLFPRVWFSWFTSLRVLLVLAFGFAMWCVLVLVGLCTVALNWLL